MDHLYSNDFIDFYFGIGFFISLEFGNFPSDVLSVHELYLRVKRFVHLHTGFRNGRFFQFSMGHFFHSDFVRRFTKFSKFSSRTSSRTCSLATSSWTSSPTATSIVGFIDLVWEFRHIQSPDQS